MSTPDLTELTEEETDLFGGLVALAHRAAIAEESETRLAVVRCLLDGQEVAVVSTVRPGESDEMDVAPLAVLVTDALFDRMEAPK